MINFSTSMFANFAAVQSHMAQVGADVVITLDGANAVTVKGVTLASLSLADFDFHAPARRARRSRRGSAESTDHSWASHSAQTNSSAHLG